MPRWRVSRDPTGLPYLRSLLRGLPVGQTTIFAGSSILVSLLGMVSTALLARNLGASDFGRYAFALSLIAFVTLFFEFGLSLPAARLVAASSDTEEARRVLAAALVAFLPIAVSFSVTLFGLSYVADSLFHAHAGHALRIVAPLAIVYPFLGLAVQLSQGADRLHTSSITGVLGQGAFLVFVLVAVTVDGSISISLALALRMIALLLGGCIFVVWIRPLFHGARRYARPLLQQIREYGFSVYLGRVLTDATYNMDVLMVAAFANARSVGLYTIGGAIAYASGLPVMGMATSLFARMTRQAELDRNWLVVAWGVGIGAVLLTWGLAHPFLRIVFSSGYSGVYPLVLPLALAQMVRGVTTVYNSFLSAHARGRELRNAAGVLTISNVVLNFALIPPFGALGAAWASFLALVFNFLAHVIYYRQSLGATPKIAVA